MRARPPRMAMVALAGLAAVALAVGANLLLIDRAPAVDPLGRLHPSVVTIDVHPPETRTVPERTRTVPERTRTAPERTRTAPERADADDHDDADHDGDDDD